MKDLNQVTLVGNLTRDPYVGDGQYGKYAFFTIATTDRVDDKEYTQFIECSADKFVAEKLEKIGKGSRVMVVGKIKVKKTDEKEETKVNVKEIGIISMKKHDFSSAPVKEIKEEEIPF
jgi:single-stranded DNA-binding protein